MSIIIMILLLSVLILVHELGHYAAAKMFGITVDRFGFGLDIGPTLWKKQFGETTVLIHAFLLGGYVTFLDDDENSDVPQDSPKRFKNRPIYQKMAVISGGVIANVICAFAFVLLTAILWGNLPSGKYDVYIKNIVAPKEASVWASGLQPDDRIAEINGSVINTKYGLQYYASLSKQDDGKVTEKAVYDNYNELKSTNPAYTKDEIIPKDVLVQLPETTPEAPVHLSDNVLKSIELPPNNELPLNAHQTKLRDEIKDKKYILSDGNTTLNDIACALSDGAKPLLVKVERNGQIIELKTIYPDKDGKIGVEYDNQELLIPITNTGSAFKESSKYLYRETASMLVVLKQLFTGKIPLKDLHGVVLITKIGGDTITHEGIFEGLLLIAMISMNLAIINFLPFPALDGGHFMFLLIEKITGRPLNEKAIALLSNIGFMLLIALMIFVVFNDIFYLAGAK